MADKAFDRVFKSRKGTVQYQTISHHDGYEVIRWEATDYCPAPVKFFPWTEAENWAGCRAAAGDYARDRAKGER